MTNIHCFRRKLGPFILAAALTLAGCSSSNGGDSYVQDALIGGGLGGAIGCLIGHGGISGTIIGLSVGALGGLVVANESQPKPPSHMSPKPSQ